MMKAGGWRREQERADRNLSDLLQELRVALPGVQVLFAFLLTVPFTQRFKDLTDFQEKLYFGVLICIALASVFLLSLPRPAIASSSGGSRRSSSSIGNNLALMGLCSWRSRCAASSP